MILLNDITGVVALFLMMLVTIGFAPYVKLSGKDPAHYLQQGLAVASFAIAMRLGYHDILRPILIAMDLVSFDHIPLSEQILNAVLNVTIATAAYRILIGLHASLPVLERDNYNWITAPFYPKRINIFRKD